MGFMAILFMLVNLAYVGFLTTLHTLKSANFEKLCVVSKDQVLGSKFDIATLFFSKIFGNKVATRVMAVIMALSVFGNIVVMAFTASRGE